MLRHVLAVLLTGFFFPAKQEKVSMIVPFASSHTQLQEATGLLGSDSETPFFMENHKFGKIIMKNGRVIDHVKLRVNLVTNETEFMSIPEMTASLAKGVVKEVAYSDTTENGVVFYKLKTGYPAIDKQSPDHFYVVLSDGRCTFLKWIEKRASEKVNDLDKSTYNEYTTYADDYYIFSRGVMKRWKKDKDFLLGELADKEAEVSRFIQDNKTSFRNAESVEKLISYYNTL